MFVNKEFNNEFIPIRNCFKYVINKIGSVDLNINLTTLHYRLSKNKYFTTFKYEYIE